MLDIILRLVKVRIDEDGQIARAYDSEQGFYLLVDEYGYIRTQSQIDVDCSLVAKGIEEVGEARIAEHNLANRQREEAIQEEWASAPPPSKKRKALYDETAGKCAYCGCDLDILTFHIDHIIPKAQKGSSKNNNLIASCPACNSLKNSMTADEFGLYILREICNEDNDALRHRYESYLVEADGVTAFGFAQQELIDKKLGV